MYRWTYSEITALGVALTAVLAIAASSVGAESGTSAPTFAPVAAAAAGLVKPTALTSGFDQRASCRPLSGQMQFFKYVLAPQKDLQANCEAR